MHTSRHPGTRRFAYQRDPACPIQIFSLRMNVRENARTMISRFVRFGLAFLLLNVCIAAKPVLAATSGLQCSPCALGFGNVKVTQSKTLPVTLSNTNSAAVTISSVQQSAPGFRISGLAMPITLGAGKTASFSITFAPLNNQTVQGTIRLVNSGSSSALALSVSGTGLTSGSLTANPSIINFGTVPLGTSAIKTQTLTNSGTTSVAIASVGSGTPFWVTGLTTPMTLAPGASITFYAHFRPQSTGAASGGLTALSSANDYRVVVPLSGTVPGSGQLSIAPATLTFGSVPVGSTKSMTATLSAAGAGVTIASDSLTSSEFSVSALPLPLTLASGQTKSFTISFTPQSSGTVSASLSLKTGVSGTGTAVIEALAGAGAAATQHSVNLSWQPSASQVIGYNIYRGAKSGGPYAQLTSAADAATAYTDASVQGGQTYYYVVTAVNSNKQESTYSNQVQATVPTP